MLDQKILRLNTSANFAVDVLASGMSGKFRACEPVRRINERANARRARVLSVFCSVLCGGGWVARRLK